METEPFRETFGPKAQRKRPRLDVGSFEELGKTGAAAAVEAENAADGTGTSVIGASILSTSSFTVPFTYTQLRASGCGCG